VAFVRTEDDNRRYRENRRKKYASDTAYRAKINERNKANYDARKAEINAAKRKRWASDPEYREKLLAPRRGRCQRNEQLKVHYGISIVEYQEMERQQGGACAVCAVPKQETLCVDHCHATGRVRGLLCRACNAGLGCFKDNTELMARAMTYLEKHHGD
jgi:hypothetical protein